MYSQSYPFQSNKSIQIERYSIMPRINIDDIFWSDPRHAELILKIGDRDKAIGVRLQAIRIAQRFWCPDKQPIPFYVWEDLQLSNYLLEVRLVIKLENGYYVKGSEEYFDWYEKGTEQRSLAGKKSALARKEKYGTAQPLSNETRTDSNGLERRSVILERAEPSSSSSSSSYLSKVDSGVNIIRKEYKNHRDKQVCSTNVERVNFNFEYLYKKYPRHQGKQRGIEICKRITKSNDTYQKISNAIDAYQAYTIREKIETKYIKQFSTFMNVWEEWLDPLTGTSLTKPTVKLISLASEN